MKTLRFWGPVVAWMAIIFVFSSRQRVEVSPEYLINFLFFKTLHVLEYSILYLFIYRAARNTLREEVVNIFAIAFLLTTFYAITDEIHQSFVPTREGRLRDVIIDAIGAILAWQLITKWLPKAPPRLRNWARIWGLS